MEDPADEEGDFKDYLNPDSLQVINKVYVEPALHGATPGERYQFIRKGYFVLDRESKGNSLIFNRTVGLKDSWAKKGG